MDAKKEDKMNEMIDAYLNNTLSPKDKLAFENKLEADNTLKEELHIYKTMQESFNEKEWHSLDKNSYEEEILNLKNDLKGEAFQNISKQIKIAEQEHYKSMKSVQKKSNKFYFIAIAASLLLFVSIGIPFLFGNTSLEDHYNNHADWADIPSLIEKGSQTNVIEQLYASKDYNSVISNYEIGLKNGSELHAYSLLKVGASYFFIENYDKSIQVFNEFIQLDTVATSRGHWYKLLVYLKLGNSKKINEVLDVILLDKNNYNYAEALEIKEQLK